MHKIENRRPRGRPLVPIPTATVLLAAQKVFAEKGYAGASMSAIAQVCGVTKAALYNHFASKEELYFCVLEDIAKSLGNLVENALLESGNVIDRLDSLGENIVRYLGNHPQASRLLSRELIDAGPFLLSPRSKIITKVLEATTTLLSDGIKAGTIVEQDFKQLAGSIISIHLFWFASRTTVEDLLGKDPFTEDAIEERIIAVKDQVRRLCIGNIK